MNRTRSVMDCVFTAMFLCCIVFGITGCFFLAAELEEVNIIIQGYTIVLIPFAFLCSFLFYSQESRMISVPVMIVFLSLIAGVFRNQLIVVLQIIFFRTVSVVNNYYKLGFTIHLNPQDVYTDEFKEGVVILFLCLIFLLSVDVAGFFYAGRIFVLASLIMVFASCVGNMPSAFYVFLLLAGILGLLAAGQKKHDFERKWKFGHGRKVEITCEEEQEVKNTPLHGGHKAAVITVGCFLGTLLIGAGISSKVGGQILKLHTPVLKWANEMLYSIIDYDYSRLPGSPKTKDEGAKGRLSNDPVSYTGETVLRITVDEMPVEAVYLRGFVGKDYRGSYWSEVNENAFARAASEWNMGSTEVIAEEMGNLTFTKLTGGYYWASDISIEYLAAPGSYAYLPYFAEQGELIEQNADGIIDRSRAADGRLISVLDTKWLWQAGSTEAACDAELFGWGDVRDGQLEEYYAEYVRSAYLSVPDTVPLLKKAAEKSGRAGLPGITGYIKRYLSGQAQYSRQLKRLPIGKDFTEYFLYEQKKGYCIHFATAAVLMYRMHGIPARFVEGYVAWPEDFVQNGDGTYTAEIPDSRAHAWAEVYYEGFGFVPEDVTPPEPGQYGDAEGFDESLEETGTAGQEETEEEQETDTAVEIEETAEDAEEVSGQETDENRDSEEEEEVETKDEKNEEDDDGEVTEQTGEQTADSNEQENMQEDERENGQDNEEPEETPDEEDEQESSGDGEHVSDAQVSDGNADAREEQGEDNHSDAETADINTKEHIEAVMKIKYGNAYYLMKIVGVMLPCAIVSVMLFLGFQIVYYGIKYRKNMRMLLNGVEDKNRMEIIRASCRFHEYMRISGKGSHKKAGENLSDREYERMMQAELQFLRKGEYHRFLTLVRKAVYCAPQAAAVSEKEVRECVEFVEKVKRYLTEQAPWYQKILMKGIAGE